ncbi:MAG TPA: protein tyrosine phosphatase [Verrucomicrobia bacterium]|nr:MAG: hypothetical protein A2X46_10810 [Lentisphaerae bacterium GWF2_57_35]HBA82684.1 protein tyrosine phosphatase [Verrucomicrobiota bacterium]
MNILFVCSLNKYRSRTAETIFRNQQQYNIRSAGTDDGARKKLTKGDVGWADYIFVMEKSHRNKILKKYREESIGKRIICLHIPDEYEYMDPRLVADLKGKLSPWLEIPEESQKEPYCDSADTSPQPVS